MIARAWAVAVTLLLSSACCVPAAHAESIIALAFSADGSRIAGGDWSGRVSVWTLANEQPVPGFRARRVDWNILALAFSADSRRLFVATSSSLHALDLTSPDSVAPTIPLNTTAAVFSRGGEFLAYRSETSVKVLDVATGKSIRVLRTDLGFPQTITFSPDAKYVAVGAQETIMTIGGPAPRGTPSRQLEVFDLATGQRTILKALSTWFSAVAFNDDASLVAAITHDRLGAAINDYRNTTLNVWTRTTGESALQVALRDDTSRHSFLSFVGATAEMVTTSAGTPGGNIAVMHGHSGKVTHAPMRLPSIFAAALHPIGDVLAVGGMLRGVQIRALPSLAVRHTLAHSDEDAGRR